MTTNAPVVVLVDNVPFVNTNAPASSVPAVPETTPPALTVPFETYFNLLVALSQTMYALCCTPADDL